MSFFPEWHFIREMNVRKIFLASQKAQTFWMFSSSKRPDKIEFGTAPLPSIVRTEICFARRLGGVLFAEPVLATGGKSYPGTVRRVNGYRFAKSLGIQ
jgi:hypothetical protein